MGCGRRRPPPWQLARTAPAPGAHAPASAPAPHTAATLATTIRTRHRLAVPPRHSGTARARRTCSSRPGAPGGAGTPPVTSMQETHHGCIPLLAGRVPIQPAISAIADSRCAGALISQFGARLEAGAPAKRRKAGGRRSARCVRMGRAGLLGRRIADVQSLPFTRIIMTEPWGSANRPAWLLAGLRGGPTTSTGPPRAIWSHALGGRWGTSASSANCYGTCGSAKAAPPGTRSPGPITQSQATLVRPQLRNRARFGRPQTLCHA